MTVRFDPTSSSAAVAAAQIDDFLLAMGGAVAHSTFVRYEVSAVGSNVRVAQPWPGALEWGSGVPDDDEAPFFWSFTGKDVTGRRFRLELFGRGRIAGDSWRLNAVDDSNIAAAIAVLETEEAVFLTIAGNGPIFNQYANKSVSQHWVQELR